MSGSVAVVRDRLFLHAVRLGRVWNETSRYLERLVKIPVMTPGRNERCPCGSGKKFKHCHYDAARTGIRQSGAREGAAHHDLDERLVLQIIDEVVRRFPIEAREIRDALASHPEMQPQLAAPWVAYVATVAGKRGIDWYLSRHGDSLSKRSREWLALQQKTHVSIWEIVDVDPGRSLTLRDAFTRETRTVHEVSGSKTSSKHFFLLGRVVDAEPQPVICGMHAHPLPPRHAAGAIEQMRKFLRRKGAVPPDRLLDERVAWRMLEQWSVAIEMLDALPALTNTDGDAILFTTDRWSFDEISRGEVIARIEGMEGATRNDDGTFTIVREGNAVHDHWDNTVIATVRVARGVVTAETNSVARADAMRERMNEALADLLSRGARSHADPIAAAQRASGERRAPAAQPPEADALIREIKEAHYASWLDERIPALDGETPREAVRTEGGRERVRWMLNDIELIEATLPEASRFDVRRLREELGLS